MKNLLILFLIFTFFQSFPLLSQNNSIKGKIIDKQTGSPIADVNVFLAYTMIGTSTNRNGEFVIKNIPPANYQIVISHIQYNQILDDIFINKTTTLSREYSLEPKIYELPDVVVNEDEDDWQDYYEIFKEQLLGMTDNADLCEILNPYNISFFDVGWMEFQAYCKDPIYIVNKALGYRITYILDYFWTDELTVKYSGTPFFQELSAPNDSVKQDWINKRATTYRGSLRDFIAQTADRYVNDSWHKNPVSFTMATRLDWINDPNSYVYTDNLNTCMALGDNEYEIKYCFKSPVIVEFCDHSKVAKNQDDISKFEITKDTIVVDVLGRTYDTFGIHTISGKWTKQRLADTLPMEYMLPED